MKQSEILVVMYHHVHGPQVPHLAGLHGVQAEDFRRQLITLRKHYTPISYNELRDALDRGAQLPDRCVLITFDDGTIDHYRTAFPILVEEGYSGLFFIISDAAERGALTQVHLRHLLDRHLGRGKLKPLFMERYRAQGGKDEDLEVFPEDVVRKAYRWDDAETARFKYAVNFGMAPEIRNAVLHALIDEHLPKSAAELGREFYLTWDQAAEMRRAGMDIGGHSHRHEALAMLDEEALRRDLITCRDMLDRKLGPETGRAFSYPYGKAQHYSQTVVECVKELGFADGFANIQGVNHIEGRGVDHGRFHWHRIDPKDLPAYIPTG
ncbi:MAG: polysaccharide deacetylase family protein [Acidobacteriota bacterium]|nr:polysaccharide deacetylase family protein [Acidobacteriota bacterium]